MNRTTGNRALASVRPYWIVMGVLFIAAVALAWAFPDGLAGFWPARDNSPATIASNGKRSTPTEVKSATTRASVASADDVSSELSIAMKKSMAGEPLTDRERLLLREPWELTKQDIEEVERTRDLLLRRQETSALSHGERGVLQACCRMLKGVDCPADLENSR